MLYFLASSFSLLFYCNFRAIRYKRILFFLDCRDAIRFVRCCFGYVTFVMASRILVCCRASVWPRICSFPRTRRSAAHSYTAAHPWSARLCAAAHLLMRPRSSMYFRALTWCHAWLMLPRTRHVATRDRGRRYIWLCFRASHMVPRTVSTCGRASVLRCRAVLHIAAHCRLWPRRRFLCVAAQSYVRPLTHGATRGGTLLLFAYVAAQ